MAYKKAIAICIDISDYSETSQIITFFTREFGVIKVIFKGAMRKERVFASPVSILSLYQIVFSQQKKSLHILSETAILENFQLLSCDLNKYYSSLSMLEIIRMQKEEDSAPEFFDCALTYLDTLRNARYPFSAAFSFALQALRLLGYEPSLDNCVKCSDKIALSRKDTPFENRIPFSIKDGGLLCKKCAESDKNDFLISYSAISAMRNLYKIAPQRSALVSLPDKLRKEIANFLHKFCELTFEKEIRMVKYLAAVTKRNEK